MNSIIRQLWWRVAVLVLLAGAGVTRASIDPGTCFSTHASGSGPHAFAQQLDTRYLAVVK